MLSTEQFTALVQTIADKGTGGTATTTPTPRIGGVSPVGAWTGRGAQGLGQQPKSGLCMRYFKGSELKAFQALNAIEDKCKAGLQAKGTLVFGLPGETHFDKGALLLRELDEYMSYHGLEGVFQIVLSNGTMVDMLKQPGFVDTNLVESWIQDLTQDGVHDPNSGNRLNVCDFDIMNLQFSFHAVLHSCSPLLRQDLLNNLPPSKHTGPEALMMLLTKVYPSSYTKVRGLILELEKLNIKEIPGENITTLVQKASDLVREIQMNFLRQDQIPDLCVSALKPFKSSSHEFIRIAVTTSMLKVNKLIMAPSTTPSGSSTTVRSGANSAIPEQLNPLVMLQELEELYITLKQQNNYPPGEQLSSDKKFKAMQGEVTKLKEELGKLTQDRSANSTRGGKSTKTGPIKNRKGELVECFNCKGNHYKKDCPTQKGTNESKSNGASNSTSGSGRNGGNQGGTGNNSSTPKQTSSGLTPDVDKKTTEAIKTKMETMQPREQIPDDAQHSITVGGKVTAKYCRHHGKFMRGKAAHFTSECRLPDEKKFAYQPRAAGNMANVLNQTVAANSEPSGPPNSHLIQCGPRTYYDFSNMSRRTENPETNLAVIEELDDSDEDSGGWFTALSKVYGE